MLFVASELYKIFMQSITFGKLNSVGKLNPVNSVLSI